MADFVIRGVFRDGEPIAGSAATAVTATPIAVASGTDFSVQVNLVDHFGLPVDLNLAGTDQMVLSVRSQLVAQPAFSKLATKLSAGSYLFQVASTDTRDLGGLHVFDVWARRAGASKQVVGPSYLDLGVRAAALPLPTNPPP